MGQTGHLQHHVDVQMRQPESILEQYSDLSRRLIDGSSRLIEGVTERGSQGVD
jgi:hypothetical protein